MKVSKWKHSVKKYSLRAYYNDLHEICQSFYSKYIDDIFCGMYNRCKGMHKSRIRRASKREGLKMEKKNWLTLKTKAGCWHLFLILVAAIPVFSFCAQLITTRGGRILQSG